MQVYLHISLQAIILSVKKQTKHNSQTISIYKKVLTKIVYLTIASFYLEFFFCLKYEFTSQHFVYSLHHGLQIAIFCLTFLTFLANCQLTFFSENCEI